VLPLPGLGETELLLSFQAGSVWAALSQEFTARFLRALVPCGE